MMCFYAGHAHKQPVSHQPFNLQGEQGGEEETYPYERADDETQPKYPGLCFCPYVIAAGGLHTYIEMFKCVKPKCFSAFKMAHNILLFWLQTPRGFFHRRQSDSTSAGRPAACQSHSETQDKCEESKPER